MALLDRFKRDITRHRHKAAMLAVLFLVMIVMTVRTALQLQPKTVHAAVEGENTAAIEPSTLDNPAVPAADADERIRQSKELWRTLREVRGLDAAVAFSFDTSFYPPDPSHPVAVATPEQVAAAPAAPIPDQTEALRRAHDASIRDQSQKLIVKSIMMNGSAKPWAIVNQQLMSVGQEVLGFEITAIRSREVEFIKDGVPIVVKMSDDIRGQ